LFVEGNVVERDIYGWQKRALAKQEVEFAVAVKVDACVFFAEICGFA